MGPKHFFQPLKKKEKNIFFFFLLDSFLNDGWVNE